MTARYIVQRDRSALVSGLQWVQLIKDGRRLKEEIRAAANNAEATKLLVVERNSLRSAGLFVPPDADLQPEAVLPAGREAAKPIKASKLYSLAAAFARFAGDGNAVLAYSIGDGGRTALIVVESGIPTLDDIKSAEEARNVAANYATGSAGFHYAFYSNDVLGFNGSELIEDSTLWEHADRSTLLQSKPINVGALVLGAVLLIAGIGGVAGYKQYADERARQERARAMAAADPLPKYEAALATELGALGLAPGELERILDMVGTYPTRVAGWRLEGVECFAQSAQCVSSWIRDGGTTSALLEARAPHGDEITADSTMNVVRLARKSAATLGGVNSREELRSQSEDELASTSQVQRWINAGLEYKAANEGKYTTWPQVPGIEMSRIPADAAVRVLPVELTVAMPLVPDLVKHTPPSIWWSDFRVWVDSSAGDSVAVKVLLKGKSYVR